MKRSTQKNYNDKNRLTGGDGPVSCSAVIPSAQLDEGQYSSDCYGIFSQELLSWIDNQPLPEYSHAHAHDVPKRLWYLQMRWCK